MSSTSRILSRDAAGALAEAARAAGRTVVFTNGCFDILHVGHVETLETARRLGDVLIVGVNSDTSVRRLKGPDRPLNEESDRARVIAALSCVDAVVIFAEDTPVATLQVVRPHVHVKGGDYDGVEIPERATVEALGGRVVFVPLVPGRSTTGLLGHIRGDA